MGSKLSVYAVVSRSGKVFEARIKEKGPTFSFWLQHGLVDWLRATLDKETFNKFYLAFQALTYMKEFRTFKAELPGFIVDGHPLVSLKLEVRYEKKGWYHFSLSHLLGGLESEMFDMDVRRDEADSIFGTIYEYFLT